MAMKKLWDISPPVTEFSPVFPGDTAYEQGWVAQIGNSCPVNVCRLTFSPHIGAHADAPLHYDVDGKTAGELALMPFLGRCSVIDARNAGALIQPTDLEHAFGNLAPRVLVRGYEKFPLNEFDPKSKAFAPQTLIALASLGVCLIGTDSASVDPSDSKDLPSHEVLRLKGMRVLENLYLDEVPEGEYELIALPLKLMTADASPVRAVLREL
jgi:arylformamidase